MPAVKEYLGTSGPDTVTGSEGDDLIRVFRGNDIVWGLGGDDLIRGQYGSDTLYGGDGNDILVGMAGKDTLDGGAGDDVLFGGDGDDSLYGGAGVDRLYGGAGNDKFYIISADGGVVDGGEGIYDVLQLDLSGLSNGVTIRISGAPGEVVGMVGNLRFRNIESLFGYQSVLTPYADTVFARGLEQYLGLNLGGGDDLAYGGSAGDSLNGGDGSDRLYGRGGNDHLDGGAGDDSIYGGAGDDNLSDYYGGTNVLNGGAGNDYISGGSGADTMYGGSGSDYIWVSEGEDTIFGGANDDTVQISRYVSAQVYGGSGIDTITVNFTTEIGLIPTVDLRHWAVGRATINDSEFYGFENIRILCSALIYLGSRPGTDFSYLAPGTGGTIIGGAGNDTITFYSSGSAEQRIEGRAGNDTLYSPFAKTTLLGGLGDDELHGGYYNDTLSGGRGDDWIESGDGSDVMIGGLGADTFVFTYEDIYYPGFTRDRNTIRDFHHDQGDIIDLSAIDADDYQAFRDSFIFIGTSAFSGAKGELRYRHADGDLGPVTVILGDINGDGEADLTIYLNGTLDLVAEDFVL